MSRPLASRAAGAAFVALAIASCSTTDDIAGVRDETDITISDITIPDITISDITIPDISLPDITIPDITIPDITLPDISAPVPAAGDPFVFTSPTGDYTIEFPGEPTPTELAVPLPGEPVSAEAFLYEDGFRSAYVTSAFDYPPEFVGDIVPDPTLVLEGARDGAVANIGGTLASTEFVEQQGVPGIEFTFSLDAGGEPGVGRALVFFADPRLYQSFALGVPAADAEHARFLDSFEFTAVEADS